MLIKYTCDSKSQTKRMRHPFQSTSKPISHRNGWSFRVYMISLRDNEILAPEWSRTGAKVAQVSCKHPLRKFGYLCIQEISALTKSYVRRYVRRSTPSCKPGWNFLLQATARFGGKLHDYQNFPKQKNSNKAESFRLKFNAYTDVDNKESARAKEKKMTETNFVGKKTCNCYGGGENKKCYRPPGWK